MRLAQQGWHNKERVMGRFVLFLIVVAAALAGVWFYAPGGKDMLLGAKSTVMGMIPGAEPAAEEAADDAADAVEEAVEDTADAVEEVVEETVEAVEEAVEGEPQN
jgi:hypothetical protein